MIMAEKMEFHFFLCLKMNMTNNIYVTQFQVFNRCVFFIVMVDQVYPVHTRWGDQL